MVRMDDVNKIRKLIKCKGETINSVALRYNRAWETIKTLSEMPREELKNRGKRPNRKKNGHD